ncbi:MAG: hypothetical protein RTU63_05785 [Candidatus Thorarchaeota archaeon]
MVSYLDPILPNVLIFFGILVLTIFLWFSYARAERNSVKRYKKKIGVFLIWFVLNWSYFMIHVLSPVRYEPSPVVPWHDAMTYYLPVIIIFSLPFIIDILLHERMESS